METGYQSEQKSTSRFAKLGMLEIGVVVVVLILIFGVLNYFSVLRLDYAFPFLSFLPRRSVSVKINRTILSRNTTYIGHVTAIKGNVFTIVNKGSTLRATSNSKTMFATIPSSKTPPRPLKLSEDIHIGDPVEAVFTQKSGRRPTMVIIYKLSKQIFDSLNLSIPGK